MRLRDARRIETPEHVKVRLEAAGPGSRFLALLLDVFVVAALATLFASGARIVLPGALEDLATTTFSFVLAFAYPVWFEVRREGRTLGKQALGLRVVDARGLPIGIEQSFVRNVARGLDFLPAFYALGGTVALLDRDGRRLGDLLADTLVVRDRRTQTGALPAAVAATAGLEVDPELARRARNRVTLDERELLAALLSRAGKLDERARYDLMEQAGDHFRQKLELDLPHLSGEALVRALAAAIAPRR